MKNGVLYWVVSLGGQTDGQIRARRVSGGATQVLASNPFPQSLAVDASDVYFTDGSALWRVRATGGVPEQLVANQLGAGRITVDDRYVYWVNSISDGAVMKLRK